MMASSGGAVTLANCADEPIHIPGAIQPHGALVACSLESLAVTRISKNAAEFFGRVAEAAIGKPVGELFDAATAGLLQRLRSTRRFEEANPLHLISANGLTLEGVAHASGDQIVLEVEHKQAEDAGSFDPRLRRAVVRLTRAHTVAEISQLAAEEVRELTGIDRVMVYRFDADWNGTVVAEAKRDDLETFLGLHYPASDIPEQARRLYTLNWLRMISDVDYRPVPVFDGKEPTPLDMSYAHLRSVSPIHIEYLRNMGVRASMSISLIADGVLIGLIACHHYSGPCFLPFVLRETVQYLGQALAWNVRVLEQSDIAERSRLVQRCEADVATALATTDDLLDGLATRSFCELTGAAGAAVVLDEGVRTFGKTPDERRLGEIVAWLHSRNEDVLATDHLAAHYPPAENWDGVAAGLLAATLSRELGEYLLWFRPSTERTVDWAGDPRKNVTQASPEAPPRLSPRGSFALWRETVRGRSLRWEPWQLAAASNIRRLLVGGARKRVAALRALNQQLTQADRAKDTFIATVSHELRTPLNAISGWSHLYLSGGLPAERRDDAMRVVARNADALGSLVDDLLDVSRIVTGNIALSVEAVDLAFLVESVAASLTVAAESKDIRLKRVLDTNVATILGDAARLRQIVTNLLSNAIKFTPKGGSITMTLAQLGSDLELAIQDTGIGLDEESVARVFEAFWQVDGSSVRKAKGLGLGLAIAKKLVELHGGKIAVESAGLERGSTFRVRLPVASARDARKHEARSEVPSIPRIEKLLDGLRVLIAEDEDDSRELLRHILATSGATVTVASTAPEALGALATETFDAIVSDIGMPEMDGLALIAAVRAHADTRIRSIPAVALTAYTRAVDRTSALRAGFQAHVPKPADPEELVTVIASLVRRI